MLTDSGVCIGVGGVVEPSGYQPTGSNEGTAPWGDGYSSKQHHTPSVSQTDTVSQSDNLGTSYQDYLKWVAMRQGQAMQQQHRQQQQFLQQRQSSQQQQQPSLQGQQWAGAAGGGPPSHYPTQHNLHSQHQQATHSLGAYTLESAGVNAAALGLQGGFNSLFQVNTSDQGMVQETELLNTLKLLTDAGKRKKSNNWLRPDHHIEIDKKFENMSYQELVHGMNCVRDRIRSENRPEIKVEDYEAHMSFVSMKGQSGLFGTKALVLYDYSVVSRFLEGKISKFVAGDVPSINAHLSAEHLAVVESLLASQKSQNSQGNSQQGSRRGRRGGGGAPRFNRDSKDHICRKWNFMLCDYQDCRWSHICYHCFGGHKGKDCRLDRNQLASQYSQAPPQA